MPETPIHTATPESDANMWQCYDYDSVRNWTSQRKTILHFKKIAKSALKIAKTLLHCTALI